MITNVSELTRRIDAAVVRKQMYARLTIAIDRYRPTPRLKYARLTELIDRYAGKFQEADHPRDDDGKFGEGGGGSTKKPDAKPDFVGKIKADRSAQMAGAKRTGEGKDAKIVLADGSTSHVPAAAVGKDWQDVKVATDPDADVQATGFVVDKKGKRVPKTTYSDKFHMKAAERKFARGLEGLNKDQEIFAQNQANRKDPALNDLADCLWLMDLQATRPGSEEDTKGNAKLYGKPIKASDVIIDDKGKVSLNVDGTSVPIRDAGAAAELTRRKQAGESLEDSSYWLKSHGATTLEARHIVKAADGVRLQFMGKESVWHDHLVSDPKLAAMLLERKGAAESVTSPLFKTATYEGINQYAKKLDGGLFTPKDFRTKRATLKAIETIAAMDKDSATAKIPYEKRMMKVAEVVSRILGNKPKQALESYINPEVFSGWRQS